MHTKWNKFTAVSRLPLPHLSNDQTVHSLWRRNRFFGGLTLNRINPINYINCSHRFHTDLRPDVTCWQKNILAQRQWRRNKETKDADEDDAEWKLLWQTWLNEWAGRLSWVEEVSPDIHLRNRKRLQLDSWEARTGCEDAGAMSTTKSRSIT